MNYKIVWNLSQESTFSHICFLFASVTLIVRYHFSLDKFAQRLLNAFETFYLKGKRVKVL